MNKGTSRETRKNIALREDYISIDERSMLDLVQFTLDFSQNVNFYSLQNKVIDNWKSFLLHDSAFVNALIATTDIKKFKKADHSSEDNTDTSNEIEKKRREIDQILELISYWSELLRKSNYKGFLIKEIDRLKLYTGEIKKPLLVNDTSLELLKEAYENIYGNIVFIKEKATKKFEEETSSHSNHHPHVGLLLAFFNLFKNLQGDINTLTKKHLDFYYKNLLQQQRKKLIPGTAIIRLQLQQGTEDLTLNEGEKIDFILDNKQQISFKVTSSTQLNRAEIAEIRTLYKSDYQPFSINFEDDDFSINLIYEADILKNGNSGNNQEILGKGNLPVVLGEEQEHSDDSESNISLSDIGIIVSSPALILEKGRQEINLIFKITPESYNKAVNMFDGLINKEIELGKLNLAEVEKIKKGIISKFFSNAFKLYITNDDGWKRIEHVKTRMIDETELIFDIHLNEQDDKLSSYNAEFHTGDFESQWPCIKLLLNNEAQYHPYQFLRDIIIENISIIAEVSEVHNLVLSNSVGNLDNSIPFTPFGPAPVPGSFLRIQNPLILQRNLDNLELIISWNGLPQSGKGFTDYYRSYPYNLDNQAFKAKITQTRNSNLATGEHQHQLINLFDCDGDYLLNEKKIQIDLKNLNFINEIIQEGAITEDNASQLIIVLTNPEIAFGHQIFTNLYSSAALKSSKFKRNPVELPNQPYTPVIEHLTVNYTNTAKEVMLRKQENNSGSDIQLIQIHPFGYVQVFPGPVKSQSFLLPQIEHKGNLFIGLKHVKTGEVVSIGFELIPAVYVHTVIDVPKIKWEYLSNNEWLPFADLILEDSTAGLIKSGIIKIEIPQSAQIDNTRLPLGKFWIRAAYDGKENLNSKIKNVFTQAVLLTEDTSTTELPDFGSGYKVQKINFEGKSGIGNISGPYSFELNESFENEESFYCRISEQMRHKNRVVSNWDVERVILDKYKKFEKVRVFGRNSHPGELVKGSSMQIVLIPKNYMNNGTHRQSNMVDFSTLLEVKEYISQFLSPYVKVEVSNPVYEELKVRCSVKFKDYQKRGHFRNVLNQELISYLSPDIENSFIEKGFDESFSKTEILNFIESRPYVEFATQLSVLQIVKVGNQYKIIDTAKIERIEELRTISAYAILTSAPEHQIEIINDDELLDPKVSGIGDFYIESDFVISDSDGKYN
jgi:hypothetical protein